VSDEQVIAQAIKALRAGPLHSHLVREQPKTVPKLYDQFAKFSKFEIQHFRKLEQQQKVAKLDEASRARCGDNHRNYPKWCTTLAMTETEHQRTGTKATEYPCTT
jgi:hypothetical protein